MNNPIVKLDYKGQETSFNITVTDPIQSLSVATPMTQGEYDHGDTVNLAGGFITVTYSDNSTEDVSMTDPKVSIDSGSIANINNNVVKISYSGKTTTFNIKVNDPVDSLAVTSPMNTIEYSHGDNLDFTGLKLTATKRSGATEDLTSTSDGVSISENVASVNSNKFTKTSSTPREDTNIAKVIDSYMAGCSTSGKDGQGPWFYGLNK